jgi:Na+/citrate or Na+/malate symporter
MKKVARKIAKKAVSTAVVRTVGPKVKEEIEKKMQSYKKKIALLALEFGFFVLGFNFFMLGVARYLSKSFPEEIVFLIIGLILILAGFILSRNIKNTNQL